MPDLGLSPTRILYDRKSAAQQLSISVRSLDYLIAAGSIPTRRINSAVRIRHEDLKAFARGNHTYQSRSVPVEEGDAK